MNFTREQQKVIDARNRNILVSAAAGSGKTAVLVERIIRMITDEKNPIDIDKLLVVTFTKAAAAQMKERIGKALESMLEKNPEDENLRKQNLMLQSANIMTIHSFCLNVIKNYFHMIDLDPGFRLAEETDVTLLQSDLIKDLIEEEYEAGEEDFLQFIETYASSKSDVQVEELILKLYRFSMSYPWPEEWLSDKVKVFSIANLEEMEATDWMRRLLLMLKSTITDLSKKAEEALSICESKDGPFAYRSALNSDYNLLGELLTCDSYRSYYNVLADYKFEALSRKKQEDVSADKKDMVKALREVVKKGIKDICEQFFFATPEDMLSDLQKTGTVMQVLFDLTRKFMRRYAEKKEERNLIDFNDLEHLALKILIKGEGETREPSLAAKELRDHFAEILIDEYQDSNLVQETILKSVSKEELGMPNRFMVGDIKQSIYKFRLAMPELFMGKYNTYSIFEKNSDGSENLDQRIDLDKNFRSREVVLESINGIFEQIMKRSVGGIDYDEKASLKSGADFPTPKEVAEMNEKADIPVDFDPNRISYSEEVELLLIGENEKTMRRETDPFYEEEASDKEGEEDNALQEGKDAEEDVVLELKSRELEARAVVKRIKELTNETTGLYVIDEIEDGKKTYRLCRYSDIVILLRSMTGWAEVFVNTLMAEGIPAYADTSSGYFQTIEVKTVISLLRIIDNPRQDIPLAAVLYSPIVSLTSEELASLKAMYKKASLYSAMEQYLKDHEVKAFQSDGEGALSKENEPKDKLFCKLVLIQRMLHEYRELLTYEPISEVLLKLMKQTGYYYYVAAMPGGERRRANLDLLVSYAMQFEKGSYKGLFHFVRYLEKLDTYQVDFGEAQTASTDNDDTVRIMSIHKSKGLEFPICIVAGLSKQFNMQDVRSKLILHSEFGVGPEYIDVKERIKAPTLLKKVIQKQVLIENLGEELRVLYVALTRAKEKLIMTGMYKEGMSVQSDFSYYELISKKSYLEYVLPAVYLYLQNKAKLGIMPNIVLKYQETKQFMEGELMKQIFDESDKQKVLSISEDKIYDETLRGRLLDFSRYSYPYKEDISLKLKMSVSEIKHQKMKELVSLIEETEEEPFLIEEETKKLYPEFMLEKEEVKGAVLGTVYHRIFELLPLHELHTKDELKQVIDELIKNKKVTKEEIKAVSIKRIEQFLQSQLGQRMATAARKGQLFRERQFVMGIPACELIKACKSEELILVQGIIDAFFIEDGEITLVDYKSDYIPADQGDEFLIQRYKAQMDYYEIALEKIFNCTVKEKIIYSVRRGREIKVTSYHEGKQI